MCVLVSVSSLEAASFSNRYCAPLVVLVRPGMVGVLVGTWICGVTHIGSSLDIGGGVTHIVIRDCNIAWDSTTGVSSTGDCILGDCTIGPPFIGDSTIVDCANNDSTIGD